MKLPIKILICTLAFFLILAGIIFGMSFLYTEVPSDETTDEEYDDEEYTLGPPIELADEDDFSYMLINGGEEYAILYLAEAEGANRIIIPETHNGKPVTAICNGAFTADLNLTEAYIPDSVKYIGTNAFNGCSNLEDLTISNNLILLGTGAFGDCEKLEYREYQNAYYLGDEDEPYMILTYVKDRSITSCDIYPDTKIICEAAFADCKELETINIPDSIVFVGEDAFKNCLNLEYSAEDESASYLGSENNPYLICVKGKNKRVATSYTIHDGAKIIIPSAFKDCIELTHIKLPASLELIGANAFIGCDKLVGIKLTDASTWSAVDENNVYEANLVTHDSEYLVKFFTETYLAYTWVKQ